MTYANVTIEFSYAKMNTSDRHEPKKLMFYSERINGLEKMANLNDLHHKFGSIKVLKDVNVIPEVDYDQRNISVVVNRCLFHLEKAL